MCRRYSYLFVYRRDHPHRPLPVGDCLIQESHTYLCDKDANVICLRGWKEPEDEHLRDPKNPCPLPICEYNGETCRHGVCVRPGVCACEVGW